jgi:transcriptional regulator with XRE-family HTH domain
MVSIAKITRQTRDANGLTAARFAGQLGTSRQAVYNWEKKGYAPKVTFLWMIATQYQDYRRDWAIKVLDIHPEIKRRQQPINSQSHEQPSA